MSLDQQAPIAAVFDANRCHIGLVVKPDRANSRITRTLAGEALAGEPLAGAILAPEAALDLALRLFAAVNELRREGGR
jgi:hypothetical protein